MGSTGESEFSCASVGEIMPNGSRRSKRTDIGRTLFIPITMKKVAKFQSKSRRRY
jgi:hypothetical protein